MTPTFWTAFFEIGEPAEGQVFDTVWGLRVLWLRQTREVVILPREAPTGVLYINATLEALPRTIKATFQFAFRDRHLGVAYASHRRKELTVHGLGHMALRTAERA